jgi:hypothetical protein
LGAVGGDGVMKTLLIELQYPDSVSLSEIKEYAQDALENWGGQRHPDDHLFYATKAPKSKMVKQQRPSFQTGGGERTVEME